MKEVYAFSPLFFSLVDFSTKYFMPSYFQICMKGAHVYSSLFSFADFSHVHLPQSQRSARLHPKPLNPRHQKKQPPIRKYQHDTSPRTASAVDPRSTRPTRSTKRRKDCTPTASPYPKASAKVGTRPIGKSLKRFGVENATKVPRRYPLFLRGLLKSLWKTMVQWMGATNLGIG